jgi:hypothetical protein
MMNDELSSSLLMARNWTLHCNAGNTNIRCDKG